MNLIKNVKLSERNDTGPPVVLQSTVYEEDDTDNIKNKILPQIDKHNGTSGFVYCYM